MPNQQSALNFIFRLIWPSGPAGGRKHTLIERLTELRDTRHDFLTDEEYAQKTRRGQLREDRSDFW